MRAYHKQIVENAVSYIAAKYQNAYNEPINQMKLYKILALFDFACVEQLGRPCTELTYLALPKGPVPTELYNGDETIYNSFVSKKFDVAGHTYKYYISVIEPDMDYFTKKEMAILDEFINYFITNNLTSNQASDYTHEKIKAWKKTWENNPNGKINYADEFEDDIFSKNEDELLRQEEYFLIYQHGCR